MKKSFTRKLIKAQTWQNMQGNWLSSAVVVLISVFLPMIIFGTIPLTQPFPEQLAAAKTPVEMLALFLPAEITARTIASFVVTGLLYLFIMAPFSVGVARFFSSVARGQKTKISLAFSPFSDIKLVFSSIMLSVIVSFASIFCGIVLMLIPIMLIALGNIMNSYTLLLLGTILSLVMSVILILWVSRYNFATFLLAEGKSGGAFSSFRETLKLLRGRNGEAVTLRASYFLWDIISGNFLPLVCVYQAIFFTTYAKYVDYFRGSLAFQTPEENINSDGN